MAKKTATSAPLDHPKDPIDAIVGANVKGRRAAIGMSQTKLANLLGITFQQVQKYEKGSNRMGASRLYRIAGHLGTTTTALFKGVKPDAEPVEHDPATKRLLEYQQKPQCHDLMMAMSHISEVPTRTRIVQLAKTLAEGSSCQTIAAE